MEDSGLWWVTVEESGTPVQHEGTAVARTRAADAPDLFGGEWDRLIDDKGRIVVPSEHRPELAAGARVRPWLGPCLALFPLAYLKLIAADLRASAREGLADRSAHRALWSGAELATPDAQGRIHLPEAMRAAVGVTDAVRLVGAGPYIELWPLDAWQSVRGSGEAVLMDHVKTGLGL